MKVVALALLLLFQFQDSAQGATPSARLRAVGRVKRVHATLKAWNGDPMPQSSGAELPEDDDEHRKEKDATLTTHVTPEKPRYSFASIQQLNLSYCSRAVVISLTSRAPPVFA